LLGFTDSRIDKRTALIVNEFHDAGPGIDPGELFGFYALSSGI
jgi:hypothetical protein